jgi:hypothetical protein
VHQELQHKRPATVVDTRPVRTYTAPYHHKADLTREVLRQARRGQVRPVDPRPGWNQATGQWEQRVLVLKHPPPAWRKPVLVAAGAGMVVAALFLLGWLVWVTLAPVVLAMLGFLLLGTLIMLSGAWRRRPSVEVTTTVRVR